MQLHLLSRQLVTVGAACRPYVYLKEYDVQDPDGDMLRQKLRTANQGGCNGDHCHDRTNFISYRFADNIRLSCMEQC